MVDNVLPQHLVIGLIEKRRCAYKSVCTFSSASNFSILASSHQHGADPTKKNRDGNTPLDLVKDGDTDIQDLLRGDAALLDASKKGCLARVQKLCSPDNINCRDTQGRNSTPLHLAGNALTDTKYTLKSLPSRGQSFRNSIYRWIGWPF